MISGIILQAAGEAITNFVRNIRIVDVLDVIIISFFLYIVLNWLRQNASFKSLISFFALIIIYVVARLTGMYLTELLIEGIFVILLIGIVVIFQSDIRRIFDRMGNWKWLSNNTRPISDIATSIITEASTKMAEKKTGALIVIKGKESWERHIHGGIEMNGKVTIPLLLSIFNKYAPGHDGAVLIEGNTIAKFGVHLPLSTNLYKMSRGGTRHTAALGISEQCDALVVVVSEERGSISIAKNGTIEELESASDLKKHLDTFWASNYSTSSETLINWWKKRNFTTAAAAVALAVALWGAFGYPSETVYRTFEVPIEYRNLQSSTIALQDSVPVQARVTLSGSEQAFRTFNQDELVISFDLSSQTISSEGLRISANNLNLPSDLSFFESSPSTLNINPRHLTPVELPVKVPVRGTLRSGLQLLSISTRPQTIAMLADTTGTIPDSVATDSLDLNNIQTSATIQKRLSLGNALKLPQEASPQVYVEINVRRTSQ